MVGFWEWRIWDELVVASKTDLVGPVVVGVSDSVWIRVFPRHRLLASLVVREMLALQMCGGSSAARRMAPGMQKQLRVSPLRAARFGRDDSAVGLCALTKSV